MVSIFRTAALVVVWVVLPLVLLNNAPLPFAWIGGLWFAACCYLMVVSRRAVRAVWFNVGFFCAMLAAAEIWLSVHDRSPHGRLEVTGTYTAGKYFVDHPVLGYAPRPGIEVTAQEHDQGRPVYRVTYRIGPDGLRCGRSAEKIDGAGGSVLFFGGSFTFGEGLPEEQTLPHLALERLDAAAGVSSSSSDGPRPAAAVGPGRLGRVRTVSQHSARQGRPAAKSPQAGGSGRGDQGLCVAYNFGFHGYGPHQMLAAFQEGLVDRIVAVPPRHVVYQAIGDHVSRAAGLARWDRHGPRYVLDASGRPVHRGHFDDGTHRWLTKTVDRLRRSLLFARCHDLMRRVGPDEVELMVAIVEETSRLIEQHYPGCTFDVLLWDDSDDWLTASVRAGLVKRGIRVHSIRDILPGIVEDRSAYQLSPHDSHPNGLANRRIASYLCERVFR